MCIDANYRESIAISCQPNGAIWFGRACCDANTNATSATDGNGDGNTAPTSDQHACADCDANCYRNGDQYAEPDCDTHIDANAVTNCYSDQHTNANANAVTNCNGDQHTESDTDGDNNADDDTDRPATTAGRNACAFPHCHDETRAKQNGWRNELRSHL